MIETSKQLKELPVGVDDFTELLRKDYYFIDKTGMITELLGGKAKVTLFTRPRRFGKSLNMSMFKAFFEIGGKKDWFDGLEVSKDKKMCDEYMCRFPVVSISLKDVGGITSKIARNKLSKVVGNEASRFDFLKNSDNLSAEDKERYYKLIEVNKVSNGDIDQPEYAMSDDVLRSGLYRITELLAKHYGRKVIVLIDEYDVPLDKAYQNGYYKEMVDLIRDMFSSALKSNNNLEFAVLTGCLRISKESIFTGINNMEVHTILEKQYAQYFGFTDNEVRELMSYYSLDEYYDTARQWYDGYKFGDVSVYCPWDIMMYCKRLKRGLDMSPEAFWVDSSGNDLVRVFIDKADIGTKHDIEQLIRGGSVTKPIRKSLTYGELDDSVENIWSVLLMTGYLTVDGKEGNEYRLTIPNLEVTELFVEKISRWFEKAVKNDGMTMKAVCDALINGDAGTVEEQLGNILWESISIRDAAVRNEYKENFYHGMLLSVLKYKSDWIVKSNKESGTGYSDLLVETRGRVGVAIELKYSNSGNDMDKQCIEALKQIEERQYTSELVSDGMTKILKYGIVFNKKSCKVMVDK